MKSMKVSRNIIIVIGLYCLFLGFSSEGETFLGKETEVYNKIFNYFPLIWGVLFLMSIGDISKGNEVVRKLVIFLSSVLLLYLIYILYRVYSSCHPADSVCYDKAVIPNIILLSPLALITLILIILLTRPKVKEQFR